MKPETLIQILIFLRKLLWAFVAVIGLYWVGKPLAEGLGHWMTRASPDKFLDVLFSFPTAIVVVVLLLGPRKILTYIETVLERGFKAGPVEIPSAPTVPARIPPASLEPPTIPGAESGPGSVGQAQKKE